MRFTAVARTSGREDPDRGKENELLEGLVEIPLALVEGSVASALDEPQPRIGDSPGRLLSERSGEQSVPVAADSIVPSGPTSAAVCVFDRKAYEEMGGKHPRAWDRFEQIITAETYLSFVTRFLLGFGIAFEVPAAVYVGAKLGLVDTPLLRKYRRHAILVNVLLAALLTPADPFSMVLMAVPLVALYEVSILVARRVNPVTS